MKRFRHKHPLAVRWFHWLHVPLLGFMVWSGLLIYWAYDPYKLQVGSYTLLRFFPKGFYQTLHIPFRLSEGMAWHGLMMWPFVLNGLLYVGYLGFSGQWRYLVPARDSLSHAWQTLKHSVGVSAAPPPAVKYNGAQKVAYTLVLLMALGLILTGLAIYKPIQLRWLTALLGGYEAARLEHFALTMGLVLFTIVHVVQVIRAGWATFLGMITGVEPADTKPQP